METRINFHLPNGTNFETYEDIKLSVGDKIFISEFDDSIFPYKNTYHIVTEVKLCINKGGTTPFFLVDTRNITGE